MRLVGLRHARTHTHTRARARTHARAHTHTQCLVGHLHAQRGPVAKVQLCALHRYTSCNGVRQGEVSLQLNAEFERNYMVVKNASTQKIQDFFAKMHEVNLPRLLAPTPTPGRCGLGRGQMWASVDCCCLGASAALELNGRSAFSRSVASACCWFAAI